MKLREIYKSPRYYAVCECDRTEGPVLYVLAGGILMYPIVVELLPDEVAEFESTGHLDNLAYTVCRHESHFEDRILSPSAPEETIDFVEAL
jgi:hypothetical protein